jgi:small subunit ribosomal protein S1
MEENKNLQEEVIPTAEGAIVEEAQVAAEAVVTEVIEEAPSKKTQAPVVAPAAEDFDWDAYEKGDILSSQEKENLKNIYDNTLNAIKDKEVVEGTVISINKREVL